MEKTILHLLQDDATLSAEQLSVMLDKEVGDIKSAIEAYERDGVILGYKTVVNWNKIGVDEVIAIIEVKLTPKRDAGFDETADRICRFPEVESVYLTSGGFDLAIVVHGKTMLDIGNFVARRLSPIEGVTSTATHFIMHKYKDNGIIYDRQERDERGNCN
ncbi:MAG: Lrp/AsnC family transcriptional regulator [Clostridia bacterium]|nr:Lrp/AsnC family transcriptional regulator [Clostridia bacterium]